ncbi:MAG: MarR family transcriptional regulator [Hyphomicrobiales bacterium]|nr:MarR family transcriptional regulator [Hyphomicrobiales bacterium]
MVTDGIERLGFLIHDSARLLRKRFEAKGRAFGLSAAQWRLMVRLVKEEGVAQARLAELLEIEPISVSRLLDRMEEGGWIERRQDLTDRRVRMIFPTDKSREAFASIKSVAGEVYEAALDGLNQDERRILIKALNAIVTNLSDGETPTVEQSNIAKGNAA